MVFGIEGIVLPGELQAGEQLFCCLPLLISAARTRGLHLFVLQICHEAIPLRVTRSFYPQLVSILPFFEDPAPALNLEQDSLLSIVKARKIRAISGPNLFPWETSEKGYKK